MLRLAANHSGHILIALHGHNRYILDLNLRGLLIELREHRIRMRVRDREYFVRRLTVAVIAVAVILLAIICFLPFF